MLGLLLLFGGLFARPESGSTPAEEQGLTKDLGVPVKDVVHKQVRCPLGAQPEDGARRQREGFVALL